MSAACSLRCRRSVPAQQLVEHHLVEVPTRPMPIMNPGQNTSLGALCTGASTHSGWRLTTQAASAGSRRGQLAAVRGSGPPIFQGENLSVPAS